MADANVAAVRDVYDALNRRDIDAALARAHPDAEFDWTDSLAPYAADFRGRDRARANLTEFFAMWEELHWTVEEISELAGGHVVSVTRVRARGRADIEMDARGAWLFTFRDGLAARIKLCQTKADALAVLRAERG